MSPPSSAASTSSWAKSTAEQFSHFSIPRLTVFMSPSPVIMLGQFDKEGKTFTEEGEGPHEGKIAKFKSVSKLTDEDTINFVMYEVKDGKDTEMFSISYKRRK